MRAVGLQAYLAAFGLRAPVAVHRCPSSKSMQRLAMTPPHGRASGRQGPPLAGHAIVHWLVHICVQPNPMKVCLRDSTPLEVYRREIDETCSPRLGG